MKKIIPLLLIITACNPQPKKTAPAAESKPASDECVFVASMSDPKNKDEYPLQLCMYNHSETRGIYTANACVTVLVEGQTGTRHPFYGSKGHWGIEGSCEAQKIISKLKDPETMKTVNPISDMKMKRKAGKQVEILKDDFKVGPTLLEVTKP